MLVLTVAAGVIFGGVVARVVGRAGITGGAGMLHDLFVCTALPGCNTQHPDTVTM